MTKLMDFDVALDKFDPVLGFEVHVELSTATKMFSDAPNIAAVTDREELARLKANTLVNEVDLGLPGALPTVNRVAVDSAIKIGLALGCQIAQSSAFSRKQYFYPDLPKNFQTSQYDDPIAFDGAVDIELEDGTVFTVGIERAHMEEDAGKLTHVGGAGGRIHGAEYSLVDYNRAGVPLVEIVTKPIVGAGRYAPELAAAYLSYIRETVRSLGVSHARMERGNLRCDANVSLNRKGGKTFGIRTETKNVNSLRSVRNAVTYEIRRQAAVLDAGDSVLQETRHFKDETGTTTSGRPKSDADDYRYFPEPDLVPLAVDDAWVERLRVQLPEPPARRRKRLREAWGFSDLEFRDVVNAGLLDEIERTVAAGASASAARKWWMGDIARRAKEAGVDPGMLGVDPQVIVQLDELIETGKINDKLAREVLDGVLAGEGTPEEIVAVRGLQVVDDDEALSALIDEALKLQPDVASKIKGGKVQAVGAVVGAVMKKTQGKADAGRVRELVFRKLGVEGGK